MSQWQVSEQSHKRCQHTFLPVLKLVGVRVSYHHAGIPDNQKDIWWENRMDLLRDGGFGRTGGVYRGEEIARSQLG